MEIILANLFHLAVLIVMGTFILMCIIAASGTFDIWNTRYLKKKVRPVLVARKLS